MPKRRRTSVDWVIGFRPSISIVPLVGVNNVVSILIVVVFPAPFGPRKAKISPLLTSSEMSLTAATSPYFFTRLAIRIMRRAEYYMFSALQIRDEQHQRERTQKRREEHDARRKAGVEVELQRENRGDDRSRHGRFDNRSLPCSTGDAKDPRQTERDRRRDD